MDGATTQILDEDGDPIKAVTVNKELVTGSLIAVFNQNNYDSALNKLLMQTFEEYKRYLLENKNQDKDQYIVYKMNAFQDLIAKSNNKRLLNRWDELILKLRKL